MGATDANLSKNADADFVTENLTDTGAPARLHYATGMLLGAEDFAAEQLYFRARMGRVFAAMYGHGTLAGLRVTCSAADNPELAVRVAPGLAMDRLGRLIEVRRTQCIRIKPWLSWKESLPLGDEQRAAIIAGVREDTPGQRRLLLDVFARFAACAQGRRPAFAAGPFDATDFVVPSRIVDGFELSVQLAHTVRAKPDDPNDFGTIPVTPEPRSTQLDKMLHALEGIDDLTALEAARRAWCVESALDAWPQPAAGEPVHLPKLREHPVEADWDKLLLARLSIPITQAKAGAFPSIDTAALAAGKDLADNGLRPIVFNPYSWRGAI